MKRYAQVPENDILLAVLLQPVVEWLEDDGTRSLEDPWNYNAHLRDTLTELGITFIEIGDKAKDIAERVEIVRRYLRQGTNICCLQGTAVLCLSSLASVANCVSDFVRELDIRAGIQTY